MPMHDADRRAEKNKRFARTEHSAGADTWYKLDNAASFMPAVSDRTATLAFRISATMTERVHLPSLQAALRTIAPRFPYFLVELRPGFFWFYLEPVRDKLPEPVADTKYPCLNMSIRKKGRFLFRVRAYRSRIAVEFCHVLTDGFGALTFLKALVLEYCAERGAPTPDGQGIFRAGQLPDPGESEDAFQLHYRENVPFPPADEKAFRIPATFLPPGQYRVTTGVMPLEAALARAKAHKATLTEFLAAVYLASLQDIFLALSPREKRRARPRLSVQIPVDFRRVFRCATMRNFSLYVLPSLDTRLGVYGFDEIVKLVHHAMQSTINEKNLSMQLSRNAAGGRSLFVRLIPLPLKVPVARIVHKLIGEDTMTGSMSNLGQVTLPEPLSGLVDRFDFIPAPSRTNRVCANVVSYKDRLFINFGSLATGNDFERLFIVRLASMGIPVAVETNMP